MESPKNEILIGWSVKAGICPNRFRLEGSVWYTSISDKPGKPSIQTMWEEWLTRPHPGKVSQLFIKVKVVTV